MYEDQSVEYRFEIERLATELQDTKKRWFSMKKSDQNRQAKEAKVKIEKKVQEVGSANWSGNLAGRQRFTGGGFNLDGGGTVLKTK